MSYVEAASDTDHEDHEEAIERLGDHFDPACFSADEVNALLEPASRKRGLRRD